MRALGNFTRFCELLGIQLKVEKSAVCPMVTFLDLGGFFPCAANGVKLQLSLTEEKASKWAVLIDSFAKAGGISHQELEGLIGRLCFPKTRLLGKFARTKLSPPYRKIYARRYPARLSSQELATFRCWAAVLQETKPRIPLGIQRCPAWALFADASTSPNIFAAILFRGGAPRNSPIFRLTTGMVPMRRIDQFHRKNKIYGMELLPPLLSCGRSSSFSHDRA